MCRSESTSINFVQLLIGLILYSPAFPINRITLTIIVSDGMGKEGQVNTVTQPIIHIQL